MAAPLPDDVLDRAFRTARTFNGFTDEPVTEAQLRAVYDLMKWGPTSANQQPARLVWCLSQDAKDRLAACASGGNAAKISKAPATVIIGMDMEFYEKLPKVFPHVDARSWFVGNQPLIEESAFRNSTLQGAYFILAARLLGFDTGPMSGFDAAAVDEAFFAGTSVKANFISTIGHGDPARVHPRQPRLDFEEASTIA
jgi:3-hydroxypropanoate dehydrogenase